MDLDLITALIAPKSNLAELPTMGSIDTPEADLEAFTALMEDTSIAPNPDLPTLAWPVQMPMAIPQKEIAEPRTETEPPEEKIAEQTPEIEGLTALPAEINGIIPRPDVTSPKIETALNPAPQPVGTISRPSVEAPAIPQVQAPIGTATVAPSIAPPTEIPAPIKPENKQIATAPPAPIAPALITPTNLVPLPKAEAEVEAKLTPMVPAPRIDSQPVSQSTPITPALPAQFTNLERVIDDPAEVQFSIKIERQSIEHIQSIRAPAAPAPVANQITTQLPQLLTKAEKQTVELRLDPPELGRVTIHLTTHDQQVTAQVVAERVQTVDLMRQHADLLTATLARAGFSEANLSFQQGQGEGQKPEQFQSFAGTSESDASTIPAAPTLIGQDGRLDIRL